MTETIDYWVCTGCGHKKENIRGMVFRFYPKGPKCKVCGGQMRIREVKE